MTSQEKTNQTRKEMANKFTEAIEKIEQENNLDFMDLIPEIGAALTWKILSEVRKGELTEKEARGIIEAFGVTIEETFTLMMPLIRIQMIQIEMMKGKKNG